MAAVPFGQLISFATLVFTGVGAISPANTSRLVSYDPQFITAFAPIPGQPYPFDLYGVGAAPLKEPPTMTWEYLLFAPDGSSEQAAYAALEAQYNSIYSSMVGGTYTFSGTPGVSGQVGNLVVADANGTNFTAFARALDQGQPKLVPGEVAAYLLTLRFALLSSFS